LSSLGVSTSPTAKRYISALNLLPVIPQVCFSPHCLPNIGNSDLMTYFEPLAGIWALAPNDEEIFIPQSLLSFRIANLNPDVPTLPPPSNIPGPPDAPTLLCTLYSFQSWDQFTQPMRNSLAHNATAQIFRGRKCKMCQHQDRHGPFCASIHIGFSCPWCAKTNGSHELSCAGFSPEH
jgi:hypothetical protein